MEPISVAEATEIIANNLIDFGSETIDFENALDRVLAQPIAADRDFPPFDRVTMDGIAIDYHAFANGQKTFEIASLQAAGDVRQTLSSPQQCLEVMTGTWLPDQTDTVIRYEDIEIEDKKATIKTDVRKSQNVHFQGEDRRQNDIIVPKSPQLKATEIAVAASVGANVLTVKKLPKTLIITSGDELVPVTETPLPHQIRSSNVHCIKALLKTYKLEADSTHIADNLEVTKQTLQQSLEDYDVIILCGGVSKGKKDFIPVALQEIGVEKLFHRVAQQPGKPFWFGRVKNKIVFAFPGNPVSTLLCARRYFIPWLRACLGLANDSISAILSEDFTYKPSLTYFLQVKLFQKGATLYAQPIVGNGSGDFANLVDSQGFMELSNGQTEFKAGQELVVWKF